MPERPSRGELESIFSGIDSPLSARRHLAEMVLMVALADAFLGDADLAQLLRALATYAELQGLDPAWLAQRAAELREGAPLFSEARAQLARDVDAPNLARLGLALAAKLVARARPLGEEEKVMLHGLADALRIPRPERAQLFAPWRPSTVYKPDARFVPCPFNDPERPEHLEFFDAMRTTASDGEFRMLTQKVTTLRAAISKLFDTAEVLAVGEAIGVGPFLLRTEALVERANDADDEPGFQRWLVRCLAPQEALHPAEHAMIATLALRLDESAHILVVHSDELSATDKVFLQSQPSNLVRTERVDA
ncbi:hypothetical protein L6R52_03505 [Myxococcota bacterium]|nr:hypothetical protein [Myxococcota bacterium]